MSNSTTTATITATHYYVDLDGQTKEITLKSTFGGLTEKISEDLLIAHMSSEAEAAGYDEMMWNVSVIQVVGGVRRMWEHARLTF